MKTVEELAKALYEKTNVTKWEKADPFDRIHWRTKAERYLDNSPSSLSTPLPYDPENEA